MVRNLLPPLAGVLVMLALPGCYASPLYVQSNAHRGTVGEIPRDGNGEPMWRAIPRPLSSDPGPNIPPAPGIPITGPGLAEMHQPPAYTQPAYVPPPASVQPPAGYSAAQVPAPAMQAPPVQAQAAPSAVAAAQAPLYPAPAGSPYILSPLAPDATRAEIRQRARDRRRACSHMRDCRDRPPTGF